MTMEPCCPRKRIRHNSLETALQTCRLSTYVTSDSKLQIYWGKNSCGPFFPTILQWWQGHLKCWPWPICHLQERDVLQLSSRAWAPRPLLLPGRISPLTSPSPTLHWRCGSCRGEKAFPDNTSSWWPLLRVSFSAHSDGTTCHHLIVYCPMYCWG